MEISRTKCLEYFDLELFVSEYNNAINLNITVLDLEGLILTS